MFARIGLWLAALTLAGCASAPPVDRVDASPKAADAAAGHAAKMVGRRYKYGGSHPTTGFDCSGLVQFSYRQAGVKLPRSLERGDLIFFDQEGRKKSHVGIYLGGGKFVHAPSSGKQVRVDRLDAPYWKRHLAEARRF